jgi:hypothetical protein
MATALGRAAQTVQNVVRGTPTDHALKPSGPNKAIMAVVASILTAIYHMLKDGTITRTLVAITSMAVPPTSKKSPGQTLGRPWLCCRDQPLAA